MYSKKNKQFFIEYSFQTAMLFLLARCSSCFMKQNIKISIVDVSTYLLFVNQRTRCYHKILIHFSKDHSRHCPKLKNAYYTEMQAKPFFCVAKYLCVPTAIASPKTLLSLGAFEKLTYKQFSLFCIVIITFVERL